MGAGAALRWKVDLAAGTAYVDTVNDLAGIRLIVGGPTQHVYENGLASAASSNKAEDLTSPDDGAHIPQYVRASELLADVLDEHKRF